MVRVESLREQYPSESFERNWSIYQASLDIQNIEGFFIGAVPSTKYVNLVVLGEGLIIDVEGCEDASVNGVSVSRLAMLRSIHFFSKPLESLPRTKDATLVVTTRLIGATSGGPYWVAANQEEEKDLLLFAGILRRLAGST